MSPCYDKRMKFFLLFLPVVCLLAQNPAPPPVPATPAAAAPAPKVPPDKVVLTVGDTKFTAAQIEQIIDSLPEQYHAMARGAGKRDFGNSLVRILVLADEGRRRKLNESPEYKVQEKFQEDNFLAGRTFADINDHTTIDDAQLQSYYDAHKGDYEQVRARHILIRTSDSPMPLEKGKKDLSDKEALAKAQDLRAKIVAGADFAAIAKEESDDTGSKVNGGDLNFFHRGQMVAPFEQAAFNLKVGEVSQPVKTQFGYHIIKVEAHESKSFEEVKPELEKRLKPEMGQKAVEDLEKKANAVLDSDYFGPPKPPAPTK